MNKISKPLLVIVYKNSKRSNAKIRMRTYKNKTIDDLIETLLSPRKKLVGLPKTALLLNIGVGTKFSEKWKKKYKL